jgi:hypothetical protein
MDWWIDGFLKKINWRFLKWEEEQVLMICFCNLLQQKQILLTSSIRTDEERMNEWIEWMEWMNEMNGMDEWMNGMDEWMNRMDEWNESSFSAFISRTHPPTGFPPC